MRPVIFIAIAILLPTNLWAQNLVPNGSFEDTLYCPHTNGQMNAVDAWYSPNTASPDYFHVCTNSLISGVPYNYAGIQLPRSEGNAYVGIAHSAANQPNKGDYVACKLIQPLEANKEYCAYFHASHGEQFGLAVQNLGAFISQDSILRKTDAILFDTIPQIQTVLGDLEDSESWVRIEGRFVATGGEQFITIGAFGEFVEYTVITPWMGSSYYYIDEVYLGLCDENNIIAPNVFTPNKDGINDHFVIDAYGYQNIVTSIYNRWGQEIWQSTSAVPSWDGFLQSGEEATEGMYFYTLSGWTDSGKRENHRGTFQLIR